MKKTQFLAATAMSAAVFAPSQAYAQADDAGTTNDNVIIVTAQRQAQSLQDVPIAVSAFDAQALESQQIENASDLQLTLPNVSFTKGNFTAASFTIRGIGDLCVGTSCDSATGIHVNSAPVFGTRLFETEYFDLERIEVLRGPQGTLFGRNATSGVVNIVTARPQLGEFAASAQASYGNFEAVEVRGMVNIPIGDSLAFRAAGIYVSRDGYTNNLFDGSQIDGRDLYSVRGSLRWEPGPDTTIDLMASYFREDDDRLRIQKQQCQRDPTGVLGCLAARRDFDAHNTNATFTGTLGSSEFLITQGIPGALGLQSLYPANGTTDGHRNFVEPRDVRTVNTDFNPEYFADELQLQAHFEHDFGGVAVQLTGTYQDTSILSRQDYNLSVLDRTGLATALGTLQAFAGADLVAPGSAAYFAPVAAALIPGGPAGALCTSDTDPTNLGSFGGNSICANTPISLDRSSGSSESWSVEAIVTTDLDGPVNFLFGGIYANSDVTDGDYYVNAFAIDYIAGVLGAFTSLAGVPTMPPGGPSGLFTPGDPTDDLPPSFLGTSFFRSNTTDFGLESYGLFGEVYWDITDTLQFTGGLRYNNDSKSLTARSTLASFLVPHGTTGNAFNSPFAGTFDADDALAGIQPFQVRNVSFNEFTGRAVLDWSFTDDNSIYFSYSRGYKSGGINPPVQAIFSVPDTFRSESVNAFEIGSRNVFLNGDIVVNATAFYYQYQDLQLSRIVARTSVNDNIDADIWGLELEAVIQPGPGWLINIGASYLNTEVSEDQFFVNQRDPSGGDPNSVIIKDLGAAFNCAVTSNSLAGSSAFVTSVNGAINAGLVPGLAGGAGLQGPTPFPADSGLGTTLGAFSFCDVLAGSVTPGALAAFPGLQVLAGQAPGITTGIATNIRGNALPQAPEYKFSAGLQYTADLPNGWTLVPRIDVAHTGPQFGNIFNGDINRIDAFTQVNAQIQMNGPDDRWFVRAFVQNLFDSNSTTGLYLTDQSSGLFTNIFTLDPQRYGLAIGVNF